MQTNVARGPVYDQCWCCGRGRGGEGIVRGGRVHIDVAVWQNGAHGGGWSRTTQWYWYGTSGVPQCGGMVERGCWPGDVGVARAGAMMCPGKSMQPRSVMSWATQGPPPSTCNPVASSRPGIDLHRSRPFNITAASLAHTLPLPPPHAPPRPPRLPTSYRPPSTARQPYTNFSPPCRREYSRVDAQAAPGSHSSSSCC